MLLGNNMIEKIGLRPCISSPFENLGFVVKVLDDYMLTFDDDGNLSKEDTTKLIGLIMREAKGRLNPVLITDYLDVLLPFYKKCIPNWYSRCSLHKDDIKGLVDEYNKRETDEEKEKFLSMFNEKLRNEILENLSK